METHRLQGLKFVVLFSFLAVGLTSIGLAQEQYTLELRNGMRLGPGILVPTDSITTSSFQQGGSSEVKSESIYALDDGLRVTYVNSHPRTVFQPQLYSAPALEEIVLPTAETVAKSGTAPSIFGIIGVEEFNEFGRRNFSFNTSRGQVDVLQGITQISPVYARVQVLRSSSQFAWDQRISPASIRPDRLREILLKAIDAVRAGEWLRIVRFYLQMERYSEAREVMSEALERFPVELAPQRPLLTQIDQQYANQKFEEIRIRRNAGQLQVAASLLQQFPVKTLPAETQFELEREVESVKQELKVVADILAAFQTHVATLTAGQQASVKPLVDEISAEINLGTIARLSDYQALRGDGSIAKESLVAYALSGWLMGPGSGVDNFVVAESLMRVRSMISEYLTETNPQRRDELLNALRSEEGAQPQFVAKILAVMKPPLPVDPAPAGQPEGLHQLAVAIDASESVQYLVQTPPEYDPNQKYPCVLALPGFGDSPLVEIDFWCGPSIGDFRYGHATRRGYIVISPAWMQPGTRTYNYTEGEHDRVLRCYRDAIRRFSVDTNRVFLAGHHDGATAAWDIGVSHPSLWAGMIAISPEADKHIVHYSDNISGIGSGEPRLATYLVYGEMDGSRFSSQLGKVANEYVRSPRYDCMVVEYRGNGRLRFSAEIPRIAEWMELQGQRRVQSIGARMPREISARTMRLGDRFFYWLEAPALLPTAVSNPLLFDFKSSGVFEARYLDPSENTVIISKIPSPSNAAIVWLRPELVDFSIPFSVRLAGKTRRYQPDEFRPDIAVMLEDARMRGERLSVFWQKIMIQ